MSLPNTRFGPETIAEMLSRGKKLFFLGIGGVSMNSLAHLSHERGFDVSGYDRTPSPITAKLEAGGIPVFYTSDPAHVRGCSIVIYTNAMSSDNPEYVEANRLGIPCVSRADFLGYLMLEYKRRIGVAGTRPGTSAEAEAGEQARQDHQDGCAARGLEGPVHGLLRFGFLPDEGLGAGPADGADAEHAGADRKEGRIAVLKRLLDHAFRSQDQHGVNKHHHTWPPIRQ